MHIAVSILALLIQAPAGYEGWTYEERIVIPTVDERELVYYLDRPGDGTPVPLLIVVDGSGCVGQLRPGSRYHYRPGPDRPLPYARLMVEKPGVEADAGRGAACSEDFLRHYTIDQRVIDHLRVLQHLRAGADWWNGELLVWGWSDGGDVATQLIAYYPDVTRAVLGAMGGGLTMAEHFEDFWICEPGQFESAAGRDACLADLRAQFTEMEDNPTWTQTWSGEANSWRVWPTRLRSRLTHLLQDNTTPVLIVHGAEDHDKTPVESARILVSELESAGNDAFEYWEIPAMRHGWRSLPVDQQTALETGMLDWLLGLPVAGDGPPDFGITATAPAHNEP